MGEAIDVCQKCQGTGSPVKEEIIQNYKDIVEYSNHWPGWAFTNSHPRDARNNEWKKATIQMYKSPNVLTPEDTPDELTSQDVMNVKKRTEPEVKKMIGEIMKDNFVSGLQLPGWPTVDFVLTILKNKGVPLRRQKLQAHMNHIKKECCKDFCAEKRMEFPKVSLYVDYKQIECKRCLRIVREMEDCPMCGEKLEQKEDPSSERLRNVKPSANFIAARRPRRAPPATRTSLVRSMSAASAREHIPVCVNDVDPAFRIQ